ncbi:hydroxyethylthiazole kinase [Salidesulfovibrio onnuriiensis]|uniref:hydroxyethylthiazole kinase n=1 Tax=Salidesulfovibrio onnuriiensis TaxID=2583823 RepID=UPI0011CB7517|nr:hydroxyethylthiazole kinase [Salidesulfovibrio onnuriiensis]
MFSPSTMIKDLGLLREKKPLVTNITNYVVTNSTANALLAIGASPIMTHAVEEVEDLVNISNALVINLGTVARTYLEAMPVAWAAANRKGIPVVLDPVGAGASRVRTEQPVSMLSRYKPAIVRGNASEIMTLAGEAGAAKGVDSTMGASEAEIAAKVLAGVHKCAVVVSGELDLVTDGDQVVRVAGGSPMMPLVTGLGCTASALCGAFAAVSACPFEAAVHAMVAMKVAGEMAAERAQGPGTLQLHLYDALYSMGAADIEKRMRVTA